MELKYDVVIIGAGHAGCEAATASAKLGAKTCLVTMDMNKIAQMSCNPAVGGIAKGQIVREIDALGGHMGEVTDQTAIQFRMLNRSKGPAMWSPRAQCDRNKFIWAWREVLENTASLDTLVNEDGTFPIPSADDVLSYARNAILNKAVEDEGITVTDEEVTEYAMQYLQTDDFEVIASNWGITVEDAESIVRESCAVYKLHDQIVGEVEVVMPEAPATCEEGKEEEPNADYGAYVVSLLGDEWDAENNTWARTDGPYYESMSTMEFSADSATYVQAETAYFVAYTQYTQAYANSQQLWTDYVNGLLGNASIEIYSLVS